MNRGIYILSSVPPQQQLPSIEARHHGHASRPVFNASSANTEDERIERVLEMSRSIHDVRSLDAGCPALVARATRLSNLYGASLDSRLARKGAGESTRRRRRDKRRSITKPRGGSPGSSRERDTGYPTDHKAATRKEKRTLRCALQKAREVALRYTIEASAGMKAFDGPPLGPKNIKDLLLRNFRVKMSTSEAIALIAYFTKKGRRSDFGEPITIEHGEFLHAIRRLRREQLKKKEKRERKPHSCAALRHTGSESSPLNALSPSSGFRHDRRRIEAHGQHSPIVASALPKVDQAAPSYDARRTESLPQTDESTASLPFAHTGVNRSPERA